MIYVYIALYATYLLISDPAKPVPYKSTKLVRRLNPEPQTPTP